MRVELQVMVNLLDIPRERQPPARKLIEEASALELKRREEAAAVRAAELERLKEARAEQDRLKAKAES